MQAKKRRNSVNQGHAGIAYLFMGAALFIYGVLFWIGAETILPTQANDEITVLTLASDLEVAEGSGGGYYYTAYLASRLPPALLDGIVVAISSAFIYLTFRRIRTPLIASVALFLVISPMLLFMTFFVKEIFTPAFTFFTVYVLSNFQKRRGLLAAVILYLGYGLFFRQYYILIIAAFISLIIISKARWPMKIVIVAALFAAALLMPDRYFMELQGARDMMNYHRAWEGVAGSRTAIVNALPPTNLYNFIINYFYAIARFNFPMLFYFGAKEIWLFINVCIYSFLIIFGIRNGDYLARVTSLLLLAHFSVMMLFEPDLGSYLRHLSALLLYIVPSAICYEQRFRSRRNVSSSFPPVSLRALSVHSGSYPQELK